VFVFKQLSKLNENFLNFRSYTTLANMTVTSDSSPLPIIETIPLGDHLPTSERVVYKRNPVIDGIIDFSGGTAGRCQCLIKVYCSKL
jgi:hypothetical protein